MTARAIKPRRLPAAAPSRALVLRYKAATRRMIDAAGDLDSAAALCGLSRSQLSRCQSPHDPDLLPPNALLLHGTLMARASWLLTREMAEGAWARRTRWEECRERAWRER